jgi:hypothetical protein
MSYPFQPCNHPGMLNCNYLYLQQKKFFVTIKICITHSQSLMCSSKPFNLCNRFLAQSYTENLESIINSYFCVLYVCKKKLNTFSDRMWTNVGELKVLKDFYVFFTHVLACTVFFLLDFYNRPTRETKKKKIEKMDLNAYCMQFAFANIKQPVK